MIDRIARLSERHKQIFSILGAIWFVTGCAVYAGFLELPDLPYLSDDLILYSGATYNAIWWGFIRPAILKHAAAAPKEMVAEEGLDPPTRAL